MERDENFRQTFLSLMKQTLGHPYELNVSKILRKDIPDDELSENGEFIRNKGFFCSELMAILFKRLKLL